MQPTGGQPGLNHGAVDAPSAEEVRGHVARVLASTAFKSSKRCHRFLDFIVIELLEGRAGTIKERTLATQVFDRSPTWDAGGDDTIVRVGAREVRKRLAQYYNSPEGAVETIRVELPLGSYVPEFARTHLPHAMPAVPAEPVAPVPQPTLEPASKLINQPRGRPWWLIRGSIALIVFALLTAVVLRIVTDFRTQAFDEFWAPFLRSPDPVLVAVATPLVFAPSTRIWHLNDERFGTAGQAVVKQPQIPASELTGSDIVSVAGQFLAFGDAVAATDVQMLLARHSKEARLRFSTKVDFADLRDAPAVIIGAFTNRWTLELTQHFRFHFGYDTHWVPGILDSAHPDKAWSLPQKQEDGSSPEDYFMICRLPNSPSGSSMLIAAGVAQFGTEAAGRFLVDPARMNDILRNVDKDWPSHNLEVILHARVIGNSPAAPELISSYVW